MQVTKFGYIVKLNDDFGQKNYDVAELNSWLFKNMGLYEWFIKWRGENPLALAGGMKPAFI